MIPEVFTWRIRLLDSEMKTLPALSAARPVRENPACVAGPPSPESVVEPLPARVVIIPDVSTLRTRLAVTSPMYRLPAPSNASAHGAFRTALVAGPPSPFPLKGPPPAAVVMVPEVSTLRTRLPANSAMKRLPWRSMATAMGSTSPALVAGPPSPVLSLFPFPATVRIIPWESTIRTRWFDKSAMYRLPLLSTPIPRCPLNPQANSALVAGPPSPANPLLPFPANVVMRPDLSTLRIRLLPLSTINRLPDLSSASPSGAEILALMAGPPSPPKPRSPLPAMVLMVPVAPWAKQSGCRPKTANAANPPIETKAVLNLMVDSRLILTMRTYWIVSYTVRDLVVYNR